MGVDLAHVWCTPEAAIPIKCYSPELIVSCRLNNAQYETDKEAMKMEFSRMDVFIMGPGLGRNPTLLNQIEQWMTLCKEWKIPIVVDGDALYLVAKKPTVIY